MAQLRDRKSRLCRRGSGAQVDIGGSGELILDPVFFFGRNYGRAPNTLANIPAKCLFQIRKNPPANPIAQRRQILVRSVLAEFQPMLANVAVNFSAPNSKKGPNNCKIDILNAAFRNFPHRAKTGPARAAKQVDQKSFDKVVGVMREKNGLGAPLFRNLRKELITR